MASARLDVLIRSVSNIYAQAVLGLRGVPAPALSAGSVLSVAAVDHSSVLSYRFLRWSPTAIRLTSTDMVQAAEFEFRNAGVPLTGATLTATNNTSSPPEELPQLIDNDVNTKWLSYSYITSKPVLMWDFGSTVTVDSYRWATANDATDRDPISWTVEGSTDGISWVMLDSVNNFATPIARLTYLAPFPFPAGTVPAGFTITTTTGSAGVNQAISVNAAAPVNGGGGSSIAAATSNATATTSAAASVGASISATSNATATASAAASVSGSAGVNQAIGVNAAAPVN